MKRFGCGSVIGLLLLNCLLSLPLRADAPTTRPARARFVTVLMRDWDRWDTNKDGELSIAEIDRAVLDPSVQDDDAAVAGTLKLMSRSTKVKVPPLTREYFLDYQRRAGAMRGEVTPAAAEKATTDTVATQTPTTAPAGDAAKPPVNWDLYFIAGKIRIARSGHATTLPSTPTLESVRQGPLGDCFLLSSVGSMLVRRPADLHHLIQEADHGGFRVSFPNGDPFTIAPLTQSQLVLSSTTRGEGIWLAAIEQAFGDYRGRLEGSTDEEGTDQIAHGGKSGAAMALLTGHRSKLVHIPFSAERRERDAAKLLPALRQELASAIHDGRLITANVSAPVPTKTSATAPTTHPSTQPAVVTTTEPTTRPTHTAATPPKIPPDITQNHSYAVIGYEAGNDMLELWNPHGQTFTPKGPAGIGNGYVTVHGRFRLPLSEAYSFFTSFVFETSAPATQPTTLPTTAPTNQARS